MLQILAVCLHWPFQELIFLNIKRDSTGHKEMCPEGTGGEDGDEKESLVIKSLGLEE